jgi:hypothetical protein
MANRNALASFLLSLVLLVMASASFAAPSRFVAHLDGAQVGDPVSPSRCDSVGPDLVLITLEGTGRINRVGPVTVAATHCVIDDPAEPAIEAGQMTLTAEDGTLELVYSGTDDAGDLDGVFMIVGGTGAFAGATGEGTFSGVIEPGNTGSIDLRGRISLP